MFGDLKMGATPDSYNYNRKSVENNLNLTCYEQ